MALEHLAVEITLDEYGQGKVIVNGVDWSSRTKSLMVSGKALESTYLTLTLWPTELKVNAPMVVNEEQAEMPTIGK